MNLLVIDDHSAVTKSIEIGLAPYGVLVTGALDGETGLELARAHPPDVILLDIGLPGMNGFQVCHVLKREPLLRDIPVIFISGWGDQESKRQAMEAGGAHFLQKPFKIEEIKDLVFSLHRENP